MCPLCRCLKFCCTWLFCCTCGSGKDEDLNAKQDRYSHSPLANQSSMYSYQPHLIVPIRSQSRLTPLRFQPPRQQMNERLRRPRKSVASSTLDMLLRRKKLARARREAKVAGLPLPAMGRTLPTRPKRPTFSKRSRLLSRLILPSSPTLPLRPTLPSRPHRPSRRVRRPKRPAVNEHEQEIISGYLLKKLLDPSKRRTKGVVKKSFPLLNPPTPAQIPTQNGRRNKLQPRSPRGKNRDISGVGPHKRKVFPNNRNQLSHLATDDYHESGSISSTSSFSESWLSAAIEKVSSKLRNVTLVPQLQPQPLVQPMPQPQASSSSHPMFTRPRPKRRKRKKTHKRKRSSSTFQQKTPMTLPGPPQRKPSPRDYEEFAGTDWRKNKQDGLITGGAIPSESLPQRHEPYENVAFNERIPEKHFPQGEPQRQQYQAEFNNFPTENYQRQQWNPGYGEPSAQSYLPGSTANSSFSGHPIGHNSMGQNSSSYGLGSTMNLPGSTANSSFSGNQFGHNSMGQHSSLCGKGSSMNSDAFTENTTSFQGSLIVQSNLSSDNTASLPTSDTSYYYQPIKKAGRRSFTGNPGMPKPIYSFLSRENKSRYDFSETHSTIESHLKTKSKSSLLKSQPKKLPLHYLSKRTQVEKQDLDCSQPTKTWHKPQQHLNMKAKESAKIRPLSGFRRSLTIASNRPSENLTNLLKESENSSTDDFSTVTDKTGTCKHCNCGPDLLVHDLSSDLSESMCQASSSHSLSQNPLIVRTNVSEGSSNLQENQFRCYGRTKCRCNHTKAHLSHPVCDASAVSTNISSSSQTRSSLTLRSNRSLEDVTRKIGVTKISTLSDVPTVIPCTARHPEQCDDHRSRHTCRTASPCITRHHKQCDSHYLKHTCRAANPCITRHPKQCDNPRLRHTCRTATPRTTRHPKQCDNHRLKHTCRSHSIKGSRSSLDIKSFTPTARVSTLSESSPCSEEGASSKLSFHKCPTRRGRPPKHKKMLKRSRSSLAKFIGSITPKERGSTLSQSTPCSKERASSKLSFHKCPSRKDSSPLKRRPRPVRKDKASRNEPSSLTSSSLSSTSSPFLTPKTKPSSPSKPSSGTPSSPSSLLTPSFESMSIPVIIGPVNPD